MRSARDILILSTYGLTQTTVVQLEDLVSYNYTGICAMTNVAPSSCQRQRLSHGVHGGCPSRPIDVHSRT